MTRKTSKADAFKQLTWDDFQEWAGGRVLSRGQSYQRSKRVQGLAQSLDGAIIAWVQGEQKYATRVDFEDGELVSSCTCPYGATCKHAVAVMIEYLDHQKKKMRVPQIDEQDQRLSLLKRVPGDDDWDDEQEDEDEEYEEEMATDLSSKKSGKSPSVSLKGFLEGHTKEQLIILLQELSGKYPAVCEDLQDRQNLSRGSMKGIVTAIRKEIYELSSKPGWRNHWNDEGYTPDYSRVRNRLESLLAQGHADEVIALGKELLEAGIGQVEMSQDEGETGDQISSCLGVVFQALPQSSLAPVEQMLWVIDAELEDQHNLCYGSEVFWEKKQKASDWNIVANKLIEQLNNLQPEKGEDGYSRSYRRDRLSNCIIHALENAGRHKEIIPLCEQEAAKTGSYVRLVKALKETKRFEEAEQWIHEGIKSTQKQWPGIASQLRDSLREMREKEGDLPQVAAFRAEDFLGSPSLRAYEEMKKTVERVKMWPTVRAAALLYLETGKSPQADPSWPLPVTGMEEVRETGRLWKKEFPMISILIDIAIAEKRPDDVLRWYDHRKGKKGVFWGSDDYQEDAIAGAVADRRPDRALSMWKNLAERQIALTKPNAYEAAASHLRKARSLLKKLKREEEWKSYLSKLRQANARKRNLLLILARLESRPIIAGA